MKMSARDLFQWCVPFAIAAALSLGTAPADAQTRVNGLLPDFTELYEKQGPAVVSIDVVQRVRRNQRMPELSEDDPFYEFFRRFGPVPRGGPPREFEAQSAGSGFIVSSDGYIVTNAHVVDSADEVKVRLTDRREFIAKVVGTDKRTDVAVIKIDARDLPKVTVGDPEKLKVGVWVVAIGKPFGLENTMTAGIVSAKGRDLPQENLVPFIQTDVAINPGNSGGPLLNMRGEVIGINSQIYSRSGGFMGISFSIPIDEAMRVADQLRVNGRVIRGRIGVTIAPVTKEVAESIGLGKPAGALVQGVESGGPAEKAGIEAGDIIVKVDGKAVEKSVDLPRIIGAAKPGSRTTLQLFRRGATKDVNVVVAEFEADRPVRRAQAEPGSSAPAAKTALGLSVSDLTEAQRRDLKIRNGVRVDAVEGPAAKAGLREGDVILALQNTEVADVKQFMSLAARVEKERAVSVMVRRGEFVSYLVIRPSAR
jgi:serine protease Do